MNLRTLGTALVLGAATAVIALDAAAQAYPNRPVKIIIGYPPGGSTDTPARIIAADLTARLGQPVVVENRVGANGLIAAQAVKSATPDGYSLLYGSAGSFSPIFMKDNAIAAYKELQPISSVAYGDWFIYAPASLNVSNLKELAAYAKSHPGQFRFAAPSQSNTMLIATVAKRMGFEFENIPYKSTDQSITAMLNGEVQFTINGAPGFEGFVKDGKLRAITLLAKERSTIYPAAIPAAEQGVPFDLRFIHGAWTTPGTPRDIVNKLSAATQEAMKSPGVSERIKGIAMVPGGSSPEELVRLTEAEAKFYTEAAALIGFKPQ